MSGATNKASTGRRSRAARHAWHGTVWAVRWHPWLTAAVVLTPALAVLGGTAVVATVIVALTALAVGWWVTDDVSFDRHIRSRWRSSWRREWIYHRRWRPAMFLSGLACRFDGTEVVPRLGRVRAGWASDRVEVRLPTAQEPIDWEHRAGAIAETFGAQECRARATRPRWIELELIRRRDLPIVAALSIPAAPNLDALPIGRRSDGRPWQLRLTDTHVLVGGATGSGKSSVIWSLIRSAAAGIHDGLVQVWACDPKGGMELAHRNPTGQDEPLFARFATTGCEIAELLDDAADLLGERAARLRGVTRRHKATTTDPTVIVVIDELATLTAYATEADRDRIRRALGLLLTQGRAVGVHVVGALHDPRQLKADMRDLFPTRIGLRLTSADQVDMLLGHTAWARGAKCERIPDTAPGCAWVYIDGDREPTWVRASWVTDADIVDMATHHAAPPPPPADDAEPEAA